MSVCVCVCMCACVCITEYRCVCACMHAFVRAWTGVSEGHEDRWGRKVRLVRYPSVRVYPSVCVCGGGGD